DSLPGKTDHGATSDLIAHLPQVAEYGKPPAASGAGRMHFRVQILVRRLELEQVAVRPGLSPKLQLPVFALTKTQGDRQTQFAVNPADDVAQPRRLDREILSGLHDHGAVPEPGTGLRTPDDFVGGQPVAAQEVIVPPKSAIVTV